MAEEASPRSARPGTLAAIGLLACAVTVLEIALMRIFSFSIWHHFASMVISIALLGFSVSGIALYVRPGLGRPAAGRAAGYAAAFGIAAIIAVALVARIPFNPTRIAQEPVQVLFLGAHYLVLLIPFTLAGLAIVTLLNGFVASVGRLYASDLVGAGLGCFVVVGVLPWIGAEGTVFLAAVLTFLAAGLLARRAVPFLALAAVVLLALPLARPFMSIEAGHGKILRDLLDPDKFPDARSTFSRWSALARVDVVENAGLIEWIQNTQSPSPAPAILTQLVIDGDAATPIIPAPVDPDALAFLDYTLSSAAAQALLPDKSLIIGAGGGVDVLTALRNGATHVQGVEINPIIAGLVRGPYAEESGRLFSDPRVSLHVGEGRAFVRGADDRYDLIQLSLIDTWAASASGAYSLSEGYLYTVEAFQDYLEHLSDRGVLTITRWLWNPPRETIKLCTVADAALRRLGVSRPGDHVVVLSLDAMGNVLVKRTPFTPDELQRLAKVAEERKFGFIHLPGIVGDNPFSKFFAAENREQFFAAQSYDIRPATDESPYFFQFGRWRDAYPWSPGWKDHLLVLSGRLVLVSVLVQALLFSLLLLLLPLALRRRDAAVRPAGFLPSMAYFFLIGLAFMLFEITLMQRFTLFLGHPLYAITLVLAVLLVAAGLGSAYASRAAAGRPRPGWVFGGIVIAAAAAAFVLPAVFRIGLPLPPIGRAALSVVLIFPLGFLLGMPFPTGIARLPAIRDRLGAAWAANGIASVIGPILAVLLAMDLGFRSVMLLAAAGYAAAYGMFVAATRSRDNR